MKLKFTPEQLAGMQKKKKEEAKEALAQQRRISRNMMHQARVLAQKLAELPALKRNGSLREAIGAFLAPYVHAQQARVANAFIRSH